jgi:hypothetical protein
MSGFVEAPIRASFDHYLKVGFSVQTSMIFALARHGNLDMDIEIACKRYVVAHTNMKVSDLV